MATIILTENHGVIKLAKNVSENRRRTHIDYIFNFTLEAAQQVVIQLKYCPTEKMLADMMTKGFGCIQKQHFVRGCGMKEC